MPDIISAEQYLRENADFYTDTFFNPIWTSARYAFFLHRPAIGIATDRLSIQFAKQRLDARNSWRTTSPPDIGFVSGVKNASTKKWSPARDPLPWPPVYSHSTSSGSEKSSLSSPDSHRPLTPDDFAHHSSLDVPGDENVAPSNPFASFVGLEKEVETLEKVLFDEACLRGKTIPFEVLLDKEYLVTQIMGPHHRIGDVNRGSRTADLSCQKAHHHRLLQPPPQGRDTLRKTKGVSLRSRLGSKVPSPLNLALIEQSAVKFAQAINDVECSLQSDDDCVFQRIGNGDKELQRSTACADGIGQPDVARLLAPS